MALLQLSFLTSVLNIHAAAALAPFHQSTVEYRSIFDDSRLLECLNGHLMTSVRNDGHKFLIEAENGRVIRGSIRTIPMTEGMMGRRFEISEVEVVSGHADNVISPRDGGPTSATRLQDFKNLLTKFDDGIDGARSFEISELKVVSGHADNVINPRDGGPTSATRLQDFKNLLTKFDDTHDNLFRTSNIVKIELLGTKTFRITSNKAFDVHADIPFTPTVYTPPNDDRSSL